MGTGVPSAIGAALSNPGAPVVTLTGDGGLMMCIHELHIAVAEGISIVVVVFKYEWANHSIDFVTVAEGMGMDATRADTSEKIREALSHALASKCPSLVEVRTDPDEPQASEWMRK
ncbi:thiamine pyrophosphate-dependent enzyme [Halobacterium sp. KA-6]|nr:thiamine pyrophosphate-dependent enzyme [Halobacterium sp. KA-6]MCD2205217.1 thiamine pyrophosphate-dependent enzyme [Halobacterium sp. KA-6]